MVSFIKFSAFENECSFYDKVYLSNANKNIFSLKYSDKMSTIPITNLKKISHEIKI